MTIQSLIESRRNIKFFTDEPVAEEQLIEWLHTATMAPNHKMTEPWEVLFVGPETRKTLNHKVDFGGAPVVMAILSKAGANEKEHFENIISTSCFIQNFLLLAYENNIGTRWASIGYEADKREILGIPEGYEVLGVFGVGHPREVPDAKERTPIEEKIKRLP